MNQIPDSPFKPGMRWLAGVVVFAGICVAIVILHAPAEPSPRRSLPASYGTLATWSGALEGPESRDAAPGSDGAENPSRTISAAEAGERQDWEVIVVGADGKPASGQRICTRLHRDPKRTHHNVARTGKDGRAKVPSPPAGASLTMCVGGHLVVEATQPRTRVTATDLVSVELTILDGVTGRSMDARVTGLGSHIWRGSGGGLVDVVIEPPQGYVVPGGTRPLISRFVERVRAFVVARPKRSVEPEEVDLFANRPFAGPRTNDAIGLGGSCMCEYLRSDRREHREEEAANVPAEDRVSGGAKVTLNVTLRNGRPAAGLLVVLGWPMVRWARTGAAGRAELPGVPAGEYLVSVRQPGFVSMDRNVVVSGEGNVRIDLEEPVGWTASVTVVDRSGDPVPCADVGISASRWYVHFVNGTQTVGLYTDATGRAHFPGIGGESATVIASSWPRGHAGIKLSRRNPTGKIELR